MVDFSELCGFRRVGFELASEVTAVLFEEHGASSQCSIYVAQQPAAQFDVPYQTIVVVKEQGKA